MYTPPLGLNLFSKAMWPIEFSDLARAAVPLVLLAVVGQHSFVPDRFGYRILRTAVRDGELTQYAQSRLRVCGPEFSRGGSRHLARLWGEMAVLAGGTDLVPALRLGLTRPPDCFGSGAAPREGSLWGRSTRWPYHDCGVAINPTSVESQIQRCASMGAGNALSEVIDCREGLMMNPNLQDYGVSFATEREPMEILLVDSHDPVGPFGAKEAGESPVSAVAPSIANAIHHAVGVWINEFPITPDRLLEALEQLSALAEKRISFAVNRREGALMLPTFDYLSRGTMEIQPKKQPPEGWQPPIWIKVEAGPEAGDQEVLKAKLEVTIREKLIFRVRVEIVPMSLPKHEYKAKLVRKLYEEEHAIVA